jgi:RHS repeat-associated protein
VSPDTNDTGPSVRTGTIGYDADAIFPVQMTNPLGQITKTDWHSGLGVVLTMTDPNGLQTATNYDGFGRAVKTLRTDGTWTSFAFGGSTIAPGGVSISRFSSDITNNPPLAGTVELDLLGRTAAVTAVIGSPKCFGSGCDANNQTTISARTYDSLGRLATLERPHAPGASAPFVTRYQYDDLSRMTQITRDDENHSSIVVVKNTYLPLTGSSEVHSVTPANTDIETDKVIDSHGHVTQTRIYPGGPGTTAATTTYTFGPFGLVLKVTDAKGNVVTSGYDVLGRQLQLADRDVASGSTNCPTVTGMIPSTSLGAPCVQTMYDSFGNVTQTVNGNGQTTTATYALLDRRTGVTSPEGTDLFVFDPAGAIGVLGRQAHTPGGTTIEESSTSYVYDALLRRTQETWKIVDSSYTYDYAYDGQGRVAQILYPQVPARLRFGVAYQYSHTGDLGQVQDVTNASAPVPIWAAQSLDLERRLLQELAGASGSGTTTRRTFSPASGFLTHQTAVGATNIQDDAYDYYPNGDLKERRDALRTVNGAAMAEDFTYDGADRLTTATVPGRAVATYTYSYDAIGNVTAASDDPVCTGYLYAGGAAGPHQLTQATCGGSAQPHTYDTAGNELMTVGNNDRGQLFWSSYGKPKATFTRYGAMNYTYDAGHQRIRKYKVQGSLGTQVTPAPNETASGVWSTTDYPGTLYEKRSSTTVPTTDHVFYVVAGNRPVAQMMWRVSSSGTGAEEWRFLHTDRQGSLERLTDKTGALVASMSTDAWGMRRDPDWTKTGVPSAPVSVRLGYNSQEMDDEFSFFGSGIVNMGGRLYDAHFKRFTSPDPFVPHPGFGPSWNRYSYVLNNPLRFVDPTGYYDCGIACITNQPTTDGTYASGAGDGGGWIGAAIATVVTLVEKLFDSPDSSAPKSSQAQPWVVQPTTPGASGGAGTGSGGSGGGDTSAAGLVAVPSAYPVDVVEAPPPASGPRLYLVPEGGAGAGVAAGVAGGEVGLVAGAAVVAAGEGLATVGVIAVSVDRVASIGYYGTPFAGPASDLAFPIRPMLRQMRDAAPKGPGEDDDSRGWYRMRVQVQQGSSNLASQLLAQPTPITGQQLSDTLGRVIASLPRGTYKDYEDQFISARAGLDRQIRAIASLGGIAR